MPKTPTTAWPMNFSTVPLWRSIASVIAAKYRDITRRTASGSNRSPSAVEPVTSQKITVTVFGPPRPRSVSTRGGGCHMRCRTELRLGSRHRSWGRQPWPAKSRSLEQADGPTLCVDVHANEVRRSAQPRHPLHLSAENDHEPRTGCGDDAAHREPIAARPVEPRGLVAEREVCLGHAHGNRPEAETVHPC